MIKLDLLICPFILLPDVCTHGTESNLAFIHFFFEEGAQTLLAMAFH